MSQSHLNHTQLPHPFPISEIIPENATTKTFVFDGALAALPGQFVMAWLPGLDEKPFSLAGADPIRLTIAAVGPFSEAVHHLKVGDPLWLRGALGVGYILPEQSPQKILQVGGGYGVAPLLFLAQQGLAKGHEVTMVIGARSEGQLLLANQFEKLGVPLWQTTEDGSWGMQGRVTEAIAEIFADPTNRPQAVYACGPTGMLSAVAHLCQTEQVPFQLAWEAHMRCGIGLCGSCEVGDGWLTCLDGPVFNFDPVTETTVESF